MFPPGGLFPPGGVFPPPGAGPPIAGPVPAVAADVITRGVVVPSGFMDVICTGAFWEVSCNMKSLNRCKISDKLVLTVIDEKRVSKLTRTFGVKIGTGRLYFE